MSDRQNSENEREVFIRTFIRNAYARKCITDRVGKRIAAEVVNLGTLLVMKMELKGDCSKC